MSKNHYQQMSKNHYQQMSKNHYQQVKDPAAAGILEPFLTLARKPAPTTLRNSLDSNRHHRCLQMVTDRCLEYPKTGYAKTGYPQADQLWLAVRNPTRIPPAADSQRDAEVDQLYTQKLSCALKNTTHHAPRLGKGLCAPRLGKGLCAPRLGKGLCAPRLGKGLCVCCNAGKLKKFLRWVLCAEGCCPGPLLPREY